MEESIVKKLMTSVKCTGCGHHYQMNDVKILGNHQDLYFLQVICSSCNSQFLITATIKNGESPEMITDLTDAELSKFKNSRVPGANDVLDMHSFLKEFDGDFSAIFGYKKV